MIQEAGKRIDDLLKLVNDWLNLSRIEAGNLIGKFEAVALACILSETMELLKPMADNRKVTLKPVLGDTLPKIQGNGESLKQAFMNLVSNAIEYNRQGGTVTVSVIEQSDHLAVNISDTGIGISQENLPFIFDEFFRVKSGGVAGSGLGLPIAKRIIEAHNGSIDAVSEPGKGTTFTVLLPKAEWKDKGR
jgi:signal transduction histidine kinase